MGTTTSRALRVGVPVAVTRRGRKFWRDTLQGYLFVLPAILGLLIFTFGPMIASLFISFTEYPLLRAPTWVGTKNYIDLLTKEPLFWQSMKVTVSFALMAVPTGMAGSLLLALLLNQKVRGIAVFRTCFYMPTIVPTVASAILWAWLLNPDFGAVNALLVAVGLPPQPWLNDAQTALPSLVLVNLWGVGGGMIIYLAGLQNIPEEFYEAGKIDGASDWRLFWAITLPLLSPAIFFNLVMGLIGTFQYFTNAFLLTNGGPLFATYFYNLMLYERAFKWLAMGTASAMAWILLVVVLVLTLLVFRSSSMWVYYETEGQE